jgi:hypothetical protein
MKTSTSITYCQKGAQIFVTLAGEPKQLAITLNRLSNVGLVPAEKDDHGQKTGEMQLDTDFIEGVSDNVSFTSNLYRMAPAIRALASIATRSRGAFYKARGVSMKTALALETEKIKQSFVRITDKKTKDIAVPELTGAEKVGLNPFRHIIELLNDNARGERRLRPGAFTAVEMAY